MSSHAEHTTPEAHDSPEKDAAHDAHSAAHAPAALYTNYSSVDAIGNVPDTTLAAVAGSQECALENMFGVKISAHDNDHISGEISKKIFSIVKDVRTSVNDEDELKEIMNQKITQMMNDAEFKTLPSEVKNDDPRRIQAIANAVFQAIPQDVMERFMALQGDSTDVYTKLTTNSKNYAGAAVASFFVKENPSLWEKVNTNTGKEGGDTGDVLRMKIFVEHFKSQGMSLANAERAANYLYAKTLIDTLEKCQRLVGGPLAHIDHRIGGSMWEKTKNVASWTTSAAKNRLIGNEWSAKNALSKGVWQPSKKNWKTAATLAALTLFGTPVTAAVWYAMKKNNQDNPTTLAA